MHIRFGNKKRWSEANDQIVGHVATDSFSEVIHESPKNRIVRSIQDLPNNDRLRSSSDSEKWFKGQEDSQ